MINDTIYFAETNFRNERRRFGIKKEDRDRHFYVIGKTGTGKTTMLDNMAVQDIQAGHGVGIIDPHGEFVERMLDFIPKERIEDVVYFNPDDKEFPVAFNIMENVREDQRPLVAAGLMGVFKKLWPDVWSARMEYILSNTVLALLEYPEATLLGVNRMLSDKEYRKKVIEHVTDDVVKAFWTQEFAKYTDKYTAEATPAIQNKVGQLITNPVIRNIIGQTTSSINLRRAMDEKKILLINLSKGKIGEENSSLIGSMLVTKLYLAAMTRVDLPLRDRTHFYLYVDEFQNFATPSFANILSEARKYGLCLTLAHQYVAQLDETVRDAIFGNVGTMVAFRIGGADGEIFEREFAPEITTQDFVNAPFAQIYVRLMINGLTSRPFSATTLPPISQFAFSYKEQVIASSRKKYGTARAEVTEHIRQWWQPIISEEEKERERTERRRERDGGGRERREYPPTQRMDRAGSPRDDRFPRERRGRQDGMYFRPPGSAQEYSVHQPWREERSAPHREDLLSRPVRPDGSDHAGWREEPRRGGAPQRTFSLHDLRNRNGRERPHQETQREEHKPARPKDGSGKPAERNLSALREMLLQIRPVRPNDRSVGQARSDGGSGGHHKPQPQSKPEENQSSQEDQLHQSKEQNNPARLDRQLGEPRNLSPGESVKLG